MKTSIVRPFEELSVQNFKAMKVLGYSDIQIATAFEIDDAILTEFIMQNGLVKDNVLSLPVVTLPIEDQEYRNNIEVLNSALRQAEWEIEKIKSELDSKNMDNYSLNELLEKRDTEVAYLKEETASLKELVGHATVREKELLEYLDLYKRTIHDLSQIIALGGLGNKAEILYNR